MPQSPGRFDTIKRSVRAVLPLGTRKAAARVLGRQRWLKARSWWVQELLRDFAESDPNGYHRFLWAHHLAYAETYEVELRFGAEALHDSRRLLFEDLALWLSDARRSPEGIRSVFEVGASLGYNLRYLETEFLPDPQVLEGCDIDAYAVARGNAHLREMESRVRLVVADMSELDLALRGRTFDLTLCAGVLMYLRQPDAERVVESILRHTDVLAMFAGLADPERDNRENAGSTVRERDGSFIHNIDAMVEKAGGRIVQRRWEGPREVDGNTLYFVFATPPGVQPRRPTPVNGREV